MKCDYCGVKFKPQQDMTILHKKAFHFSCSMLYQKKIKRFKLIKLPNLEREKITNYLDFYRWLLRKMKQPKDTKIDNTVIYMTVDNEKMLADYLKAICRNKNKHMSNKWFDYSWAMLWLNASPNRSNPEAIDGYALVDEKKVYVKSR